MKTISMPSKNASRDATVPVTGRYWPFPDAKASNINVAKLRGVVELFGLSLSDVGKAAGVSRCYVSRLLSEHDAFIGSPEFWRRLEGHLGDLVANRRTQVFQVNPVTLP